MTADPTIIRASSLADFADCARRGAARIVRREIEAAGFVLRDTPRGVGAAIGTAVHRSAEVSLGEKARTGALPPENVATDCAADEVKEAIKQGVSFEGPRGTTQTRDEAVQQVTSMARSYQREVAPGIEPVLLEQRLEAEVAPGLILSGQPDIVAREPDRVRDTKTSAKRSPGNHNLQIGSYSLLSRSHGYDIKEASIDFVQRVRPGKPQPNPIEQRAPLAVAESAAVNMLRHIEEDIRVFREGDLRRRILPGDPWAFTANPRSFVCAEKYCPAYGMTGPHAWCREWQSREE